MTFEPSASQAQIDARQHAFDNQPDPATLVSREEIRAALLDRHTAATQDKLDAAVAKVLEAVPELCGGAGTGSTGNFARRNGGAEDALDAKIRANIMGAC